jgi:hypothetical protein
MKAEYLDGVQGSALNVFWIVGIATEGILANCHSYVLLRLQHERIVRLIE